MHTPTTRDAIEFPIDQAEQAYLKSRKNLLAQDVFEKIVFLLADNLEKLPSKGFQELDEVRKHDAILVHGGRGTGKSSVLVNLRTYIAEEPQLSKKLLVLKPVDPTLLENGEELLLNIIVAALMRDPLVKETLQTNERLAETFYDQLHRLGAALEGIQKQKDQFGLDKLRAFIGNQDLAEHVHRLFKCTLELTDRQLIVMPIDDVDTALQHAFENIEVVRKYLTSPYVVPIISGDLDLYDDVIKREFLGRLLAKVPANDFEERERARALAAEYQRKVLPLPRRIPLPELTSYLSKDSISLVDGKGILFPLPMLRHWIEALLNERVNGEENSYQRLPLLTVREMAQFIRTTKDLLPNLGQFFEANGIDSASPDASTTIRRNMFMASGIAKAVQEFASKYTDAYSSTPDEGRRNRTTREQAYRELRDAVAGTNGELPKQHSDFLKSWYQAMCGYFFYQHNGASAYFTASTNLFWLSAAESPNQPIFAIDMFEPQNYRSEKYPHFAATSELRKSWANALEGKVPTVWLERLPAKTALPYPIPERGQRITVSRSSEALVEQFAIDPVKRPAVEFIRRLMIHWSFYAPNRRSNLILTGRLFELLVTSLVRDLSAEDISRVIDRAPFYSVAAMANTKMLTLTANETSDEADEGGDATMDENSIQQLIHTFVQEVNTWRQQHRLLAPHSWFIYNVMNKCFNQVGFFNNPNPRKQLPNLRDVIAVGVQSFNSIWAAIGSFEKGEIFGLPRVIAHINMSAADRDFHKSQLYSQNIRPFLQEKNETEFFDFKTGSLSFALDSHPLRKLLDEALNATKIPLASDIPVTELGGFTLNPPTQEELKRLDRIVNRSIGKSALDNLVSLSADQIRALVEPVREECLKEGLLPAYTYTATAKNLPSASGRKKLQRCLQRLDALNRGDNLPEERQ